MVEHRERDVIARAQVEKNKILNLKEREKDRLEILWRSVGR